MNHLIIIKGEAYDEIKLLLQDLHSLPLYESGLQKDIDIELYRLADDLLAIRANKRLGGTFFSTLLYLLDDPCHRKHKTEIRGYITGLNSNELKGKKLMMYVSKRGTKHSVFAISECGEHYRINSSGKATRVNYHIAIYRNPDIDLNVEPEIIPVEHMKYVGRNDRVMKMLGYAFLFVLFLIFAFAFYILLGILCEILGFTYRLFRQ
jgi:hypothetical protein